MSFGRENPWASVIFDKEGPGTEVGVEKNKVINAKTAMDPNSCAALRGVSGGIGLPKRVCCLGIVKAHPCVGTYIARLDYWSTIDARRLETDLALPSTPGCSLEVDASTF